MTPDQANADILPLAKLLGIRFIRTDPDRVQAELVVRAEFCTRPAVAHGGAIMALADTVSAVATIVNIPEGAGTTTIESKTNFVAAAPEGSVLVATATPVHRGRRTQVWQTRIETAEGKLVALTSQTQLVL
jgi:1,4-dihydroxy-2-naphthoyl-CoA hydrolase